MDSLTNPGLGTMFWLLVVFILLVVFLKKYAWKPILGAINDRNNAIDKAMFAAEEARAEVAQMKADNERIINEAKLQKEAIIKEARAVSNKIIAESKEKAGEEAQNILAEAQRKIVLERQLAVKDIKSQVVVHAVDIAEKILKEQMNESAKQEQYLNSLVKNIEIN